MLKNPMTSTERRAVFSLSSIMMLRMIGLFMVIPALALYSSHLHNATPTLIGLAVGIYGLSQAIFQIPLGSLSDRFGRKPIIAIGLIIFCIGSLCAGLAHNIYLMIIGRALQGVGAIGSTILAFLSDLTREEQRTKTMAISGISIGLSFSLALILGPFLMQWLAINTLFFLAVLAGIAGIILLYLIVPNAPPKNTITDHAEKKSTITSLLTQKNLMILIISMFMLHAIFTANFIIIPIALLQHLHLSAQKQWIIFLPTLLIGLSFSFFCIGLAESKKMIKPFFILGILLLITSQFLFLLNFNIMLTFFIMCLFFAGFSLLEAFLPSLISRIAPNHQRGSAMGLYSCSQFSGIFVGGAIGGWLYGQFSFAGIYYFCILLTLIWLSLTFFLKLPKQTPHLRDSSKINPTI